jgi:stage V sporulation protein S
MNITSQTVLRVAAQSNPNKVAGALANMLRQFKGGTLQAIGAGANNQMLKATAIAQGYVTDEGIKVSFSTEMADVEVDGQMITATRIVAKASKVPQRVNGKFAKAQ